VAVAYEAAALSYRCRRVAINRSHSRVSHQLQPAACKFLPLQSAVAMASILRGRQKAYKR
jgi:hypothetical protein